MKPQSADEYIAAQKGTPLEVKSKSDYASAYAGIMTAKAIIFFLTKVVPVLVGLGLYWLFFAD